MSESHKDALIAYGEAVDDLKNAREAYEAQAGDVSPAQERVNAAKQELADAKAALAEAKGESSPAQDEYNKALDAVKAAVEALGGADPFKALKGAGIGRRRQSGPRDPARKRSVLVALQEGGTVSEIVAATGREDVDGPYVNSIIAVARKANQITQEGERGSYVYTYTGEVDED